jgi:hypothetical protein
MNMYRWRYGWQISIHSLGYTHIMYRSEHIAKEGPGRIKYKCLVPIYVFPEMKLLFPKHNYNVLSPSSYTHISVRNLHIPGSVCLLGK